MAMFLHLNRLVNLSGGKSGALSNSEKLVQSILVGLAIPRESGRQNTSSQIISMRAAMQTCPLQEGTRRVSFLAESEGS